MECTRIIRHWKERRSKCSLTPLEGREDLEFIRARPEGIYAVAGCTILGLDAPVLSEADGGRPLVLLDSTWRLLPDLECRLSGRVARRSLPAVKTAYPRVSKVSEDPLGGLASVEALYLAHRLLGVRDDSLLAGYYWREQFLENLAEAGF